MKSVLSGQWHLIVHKEFGAQLYDWVHDPGELDNLIHTSAGEEIASTLMAKMEDVLTGKAGDGTNARLSTLLDTLSSASTNWARTADAAKPVNDYYRLQANGGSVVTVAVQTKQKDSSGHLDPVLTIISATGEILRTCRVPGDDHTDAPGVADSTPNAFDDICVSDDVNPGVDTDAKLEFLTPKGSRPAELYVRVSDWNGRFGPAMDYRIEVQAAHPDATLSQIAGPQLPVAAR
jgi:hypothetical protein